MSARCWKTLFGTISPNTQISGATRTTASQLPASPKSEIISAVAMVELATTAILVPTRVVDSNHSGRFSSISSAMRAPREPLAAS